MRVPVLPREQICGPGREPSSLEKGADTPPSGRLGARVPKRFPIPIISRSASAGTRRRLLVLHSFVVLAHHFVEFGQLIRGQDLPYAVAGFLVDCVKLGGVALS